MSDHAIIYIHGFGTEWVPEFTTENTPDPTRPGRIIGTRKATGNMKQRDWVEYAPLGGAQKTMVREWIELLQCVQPMTGRGANNPAVIMANARWEAIRPRYEAWKAGQDVPVDGIPLVAWSGIPKQLVEVLKGHGVRTVQELSLLTDTHKQTMGVMGLGTYIDNAKRFLIAQDKTAVASELEKKDVQIKALESAFEEQKAQIAELVKMVSESQPAAIPKRRGRPPKEPAQVEAA